MQSKISWALILTALGLALSVPSLIANGNASPEPVKNSPASPSAREKEKENKPDSHTQKAQSTPSPSSETPIVVRDPPAETQKERTKTEPQYAVPQATQEGVNWGSVPD